MTDITLRVLDGADRGRTFEGMTAPITIGREEGNSIQLNDERVSRYHLKIQEDHSKLVLTDLESTNGTKVNGEDIQFRILRYGDMIALGRSVLLFGTREQIARRLAHLRGDDPGSQGPLSEEDLQRADPAAPFDFGLQGNYQMVETGLQILLPPELTDQLSPAQAAQLAELLEYLRIRVRHLLSTVEVDEKNDRVTLDIEQWQHLLDLQSRLAEYLRAVGEPDNGDF